MNAEPTTLAEMHERVMAARERSGVLARLNIVPAEVIQRREQALAAAKASKCQASRRHERIKEAERITDHGPPCPPRARAILQAVADEHGLSVGGLIREDQRQKTVRARAIAMHRVMTELNWSLPQIGKLFGGRDHTTVMHAIRRVQSGRYQ